MLLNWACLRELKKEKLTAMQESASYRGKEPLCMDISDPDYCNVFAISEFDDECLPNFPSSTEVGEMGSCS